MYKECATCNENILFSTIHNEELDAEVTRIRVRTSSDSNNEMEKAAKRLFQVVKDHNNNTIQEMLHISNVYCYKNSEGTPSDDDEEDDEPEFASIHFPNVPCCIIVVNESEFRDRMATAVTKLESDGLVVDIGDACVVKFGNPPFSSNNDVAALIDNIDKCMKLCDHALYRSEIYTKPEGSSFTFVKMMDVTSYLHKLLANEVLRDKLIQHFQAVDRLLSHPACAIIQQIKFDVDLIEVSNGYCFSIKARKFIVCPIPESMRGKLSPRSFVPHDSSKPPNPGYFREGIFNSFPDNDVRVRFLNKLYQCLLAFSMPHKVRKLVVVGPKDSAKTSWSNIFHRVIPASYIASLTNERQFSAAMINNETQLVVVDEWSASKMQSDLAKCILQGGWMVSAVKHGLPKTVLNNSPFYITTNNLPNFGKEEDDNVQRRIEIFTTTSLPQTLPGIDKWIYDHAMDCIAWIAEEINANREHIDRHELWYEPNHSGPLTIAANEGESLFSDEHVRRISNADLREEDPCVVEDLSQTIHAGFAAELRSRRLARKRRAARGKLNSDDDSTSEEIQEHNTSSSDGEKRRDDMKGCRLTEDNVVKENPQTMSIISAENRDEETTDNPRSKTTTVSVEQPLNDDQLSNDEETMDSGTERTDNARANTEASTVTVEQLLPVKLPQPANEASPDEEVIDSQTIRTYSPPAGWVLNKKTYMSKVACLIRYGFIKMKKGELYSFNERRDKAKLKRTKKERDFWTIADPIIDAWMLVTGQKRDVFDIESFVQQNREIVEEIGQVRKNMKVLILRSRCPLLKALQKIERRERGEESEEQVEVPSQTYWTTFKSWRPW